MKVICRYKHINTDFQCKQSVLYRNMLLYVIYQCTVLLMHMCKTYLTKKVRICIR